MSERSERSTDARAVPVSSAGTARSRTSADVHAQLPRSDRTPHPSRRLLHPLRAPARALVRRKYDVRVHHPERVPSTGPVILAANHIGLLDGILLAIFAPRPVHVLTKNEMFTARLGRFLLESGQIPLDRWHTDPGAVRSCLRVLRDGGVVGIFPEGRRGNGEFDRFHRGAAYLALATGAAVVPVAFFGTRLPGGHTDSMPPRGARIDLVMGEPITVDAVPWPRTRALVGQTSARLRTHLTDHLRQAERETGLRLPGPLPTGNDPLDEGAA